MKITYLKLVNVAGIYVGMNREELEIDFSQSKDKIIGIISGNGKGKSVLLSAMDPFAYSNLDERSNISFIRVGKNGYKEIRYQKEKDEYVIKHYYKATKNTHSVKSYISLNGIELNENGNVSSFLMLIEKYFGLTMDNMRLLRMGSNVNSFISLKPADRKAYIGRLMDEIDTYLKIYRKVNEDMRIIKVLMQTNANNLRNCHITDILLEEKELQSLQKEADRLLVELRKVDVDIDRIRSIRNNNDINALLGKKHNIESSLRELDQISNQIQQRKLNTNDPESYQKEKNRLTDRQIETQSQINAHKIQIDSLLSDISVLEVRVKRSSVINNISSLQTLISGLMNNLNGFDDVVKTFSATCTSDELSSLISKLQSLNTICSIIYTFDKNALSIYMKLIEEKKDINKFLQEQIRMNINRVSETDLRKLLDKVFADDSLIMPVCENEQLSVCPYFRLYDMINEHRRNNETEIYDKETLDQIRIISQNVDHILNSLYEVKNTNIPKGLMEIVSTKSIYNRLRSRLLLFDLTDMERYLSLIRSHERYIEISVKLEQHKRELSLLRQSSDHDLSEKITSLNKDIGNHKHQVNTLEQQLIDILNSISSIDDDIGLISKFIDGEKYRSLLESSLKETESVLIPLRKAGEEEQELRLKRQHIQNKYDVVQSDIITHQTKISDYRRLINESEMLNDKFTKTSIVLEAASTKKGIPLIYMNAYLARIKLLTNDLLSIIYDEDLVIHEFNVTADTFEVSYRKNGIIIPDIRYASQSELSLMTMALSFALAYNATEKYSIFLLDEVDGGLDDENRMAFLKMLYRQMLRLNCQQVFMVSHNTAEMGNIEMSAILLDDREPSKLQNVIYSPTKG